MADLIDTITNAVADVEQGTEPEPLAGESLGGDDGGGSVDAGGDEGDGVEAGPEAVSPSSRVAGAETEPDAVAAPRAVPPDELTKELEAFGIKPPADGKEGGRFRWSQVRKVVENSRKKLNEQHSVALKRKDQELASASERLKSLDAVDAIIVNDPDRYIGILATIHPDKYGKYVNAGKTDAAAPPAVRPGDDPPGPDAHYADGTDGYSTEGLKALLAWQKASVIKDVTEEVEAKYAKRFGPIEQEWKQTRAQQEFDAKHIPIVRGQIAAAREMWGKGVDTHEAEIVKTLAENDGQQGRPFLSFDACVAKVLLPKTRADRNAMRESVLAELQGRPAAAGHTGAGASAAGSGQAAPANGNARPLEDVIRGAVAASGLRG
jgi:hypothetical protein